MIYTITFNPALDYVITMENFELGKTNRTSSEQILVGGKGINVSTVLHNLGVRNTALGFVAGFTGREIINRIEDIGFEYDFIELTDGHSRINIKFKDVDGMEINGKGPDVDEKNLYKLYQKLDKIKSKDVLVLSGSIPESLPSSIYKDIMVRLSNKNVMVVVDAVDELLLNVLSYKPFLIKPNIDELSEIFNLEISEESEIIKYAKRLQDMGAQNVLVSMGSKGAVLLDKNGEYHKTKVPDGTLVNAVGAGDSMVAGFIAGWLEKLDFSHALKMGVCTGSASAFSDFLAKKEDVYSLYNSF